MKRLPKHILRFYNPTITSSIFPLCILFKVLRYTLIVLLCVPFLSTTLNAQVVLINGPSSICQGDSATFTATTGYSSYRWSTGATTPSIRVGAGGTYSVTVTDAQNMTIADSKILTINTLPSPIISGVPYVCNGRSTSLVVDNSYRAVFWSTGERTETIMVTNPITYSVTVTDFNSCVGSANITVLDGSRSYNALLDTVKICEGDSAVLDASTSFAISYYWNTDDTTATLIARDSGRYNVIISTGQCVNYDTVHVLILSPPIVNLGVDTAICKGDTVTLKAEESPLYTYRWSDGSSKPTFDVREEGIYNVEVSFGNCRASDTIDIAILISYRGLFWILLYVPLSILSMHSREEQSFINGILGVTNRA